MDDNVLLSGLLIGFGIAAPVGPIGVLCIKRTLNEGRLVGIATGLGAATADALYGLVAGLGLTSISSMLVAQQGWLRFFGGLFLLYLGVRTFVSRPPDAAAPPNLRSLPWVYATTFLLTISNPMTILSFVAIFAGLGVVVGGSYASVAFLVLAVFTGSATWWLLLVGLVGWLRLRLSADVLRWVNRLSGVLISAFGLLAILSLLA